MISIIVILVMILNSSLLFAKKKTKWKSKKFLTIKIGSPAAKGPWLEGLKGIKKGIEKKTDEAGMRVHPVIQGGTTEKNLIETGMEGDIGIIAIDMTSLAEFIPELKVLFTPWLFGEKYGPINCMYAKLYDDIAKILAKYGIILLATTAVGLSGLLCKEEITSLYQIKGLKIRIRDLLLLKKLWKSSLKAEEAEYIGLTQVRNAFSTNQIDCADSAPLFSIPNWGDLATHFVRTYHGYGPAVIILFPKWIWKKLLKKFKILTAPGRERIISEKFEKKLLTAKSKQDIQRIFKKENPPKELKGKILETWQIKNKIEKIIKNVNYNFLNKVTTEVQSFTFKEWKNHIKFHDINEDLIKKKVQDEFVEEYKKDPTTFKFYKKIKATYEECK